VNKLTISPTTSNRVNNTKILHCRQCNALDRCLNAWLDKALIRHIYPILKFRGPFKKDEAIYSKEDPVRSIFVVRSGAVKIKKTLDWGAYDIEGFYFTGDLFGLDSLDDRIQGYDAIALEETEICEIPLKQFEELSASIPKLQQMFVSELANQIRQKTDRLYNERYLKAEDRVRLFLKEIFERNREQINSNKGKFPLPMAKIDIALYLGMTPESLSRGLTKLQRQGVIRNHLRHIECRNTRKLMLLIAKP
jgi:CRP/FNR family transcriptional regulator, anaerobic regulatory protein